MKRVIYMILAMLTMGACTDDSEDFYSKLPSDIQQFVSQYFPNSDVNEYTTASWGYEVVIKNGPTLEFDTAKSWIEVDGNGSTLPQVFLFDQLPADLYVYLESTQNVNNVFEVERDATRYQVELLSSELYYTIATGEITGK